MKFATNWKSISINWKVETCWSFSTNWKQKWKNRIRHGRKRENCGNLKNNTSLYLTHPVARRRGDVVATSVCTSQRRRSYVSNETPNDVSMEHCQDVSVVRLHNILLERHDDVSRGRNSDVSSVRLHYVSSKSQMKHPVTSHWYVIKASQWYVSTTSH